MLDHVDRRVLVALARERCDRCQVVTAGDQRKLYTVVATLRQPDVGRQSVAEAPTSNRVGHVAWDGHVELSAGRIVDAVAFAMENPEKGIRERTDSRVAFVHPASSGGVLTEIVQPAEGH